MEEHTKIRNELAPVKRMLAGFGTLPASTPNPKPLNPLEDSCYSDFIDSLIGSASQLRGEND